MCFALPFQSWMRLRASCRRRVVEYVGIDWNVASIEGYWLIRQDGRAVERIVCHCFLMNWKEINCNVLSRRENCCGFAFYLSHYSAFLPHYFSPQAILCTVCDFQSVNSDMRWLMQTYWNLESLVCTYPPMRWVQLNSCFFIVMPKHQSHDFIIDITL